MRSANLRSSWREKPEFKGFRHGLYPITDLQTLARFPEILINRARRQAEMHSDLGRGLSGCRKAQTFDLTGAQARSGLMRHEQSSSFEASEVGVDLRQRASGVDIGRSIHIAQDCRFCVLHQGEGTLTRAQARLCAAPKPPTARAMPPGELRP